MKWSAIGVTLLVVCGWIVALSSCALTVTIILLGEYHSLAELVAIVVTTVVLLGILIGFQYVGEVNTLELKKLKAIQKMEGTVVLKRGPRGRFLKPDVN